MSGDHNSAPPAKKQKLSYNCNAQVHMGDMSPGDPLSCKYMKQEEIEKLKRFQVIDEGSEGSNHEHSDGSDGIPQGMPKEDTTSTLEEGHSDNSKTAQQRPGSKDHFIKTKIFLKDKLKNPSEFLPLNWISVRHASGMPVYMNLSTRVCTFSKPYYLGMGHNSRHNIPMTSIPCYAYRRALEEAKEKIRDQSIDAQVRNDTCTTDGNSAATCNDNYATEQNHGSAEHIQSKFDDFIKQDESDDEETEEMTNEGQVERSDQADAGAGSPSSLQPAAQPGGALAAPPPPLALAGRDSWQNQQLTPLQLNNYCKTLFHFKTNNMLYFRSWAARRKYYDGKGTLQCHELPEAGTGLHNNEYWVSKFNAAKSMGLRFLAVLHDYVRRVLYTRPTYEFSLLDKPLKRHQATIYIGDKKCGVGHGSSKRQAKSAAARACVHILLPETKDEEDEHAPHNAPAADFAVFDSMSIEDSRVIELCQASCQPTPFAMLRTCLLRNFGNGHRVNMQINKMDDQNIELIMTVGKHTTTVVSETKRTATQRASQTILQMLHPQVRSWGSLMRMYEIPTLPTPREEAGDQQLEQQQLEQPQLEQPQLEQPQLEQPQLEQEPPYKPRRSVLVKLREEMRKLQAKDATQPSVGTLQFGALPAHTASNLDLVDV